MLHQEGIQSNIKDIKRSLDRLKDLSYQRSAIPSIPAFFYSADLLYKYAKNVGTQNVQPVYFRQFQSLMQQFVKHDFSNMTKNHQSIVDNIVELVESQIFIQATHPQIKTQRTSYEMQRRNTQHSKNGNNKTDNKIQNKQNTQNKNNQQWRQIETAYQEHNIDQAFKKASQYIEKSSNKITQSQKAFIQKICYEYNNMTNFYKQFDEPGWIFDKQQKGISLQYKVYQQQKQVAIRIIGQFPIPIVQFLSIISQIDLMGQYVPFCYDCKQLKILSRNQRIGTSKVYIPLLSDRETFFYAVGYDRMKQTGSLFFYSKTIGQQLQKQLQFQLPKPNQKFVRLQYKFFIVEYKPLKNGNAYIRLSSKVDMKMNYLPLFIINKSARIFAFDYFKNILQRIKNFKGSQWQNKVKQKPDMYQFFYKQLKKYQN